MAKMATREAYGKALAQLILEDKRIVVLDADLSKSTKTADAKAVCPERHYNVGIAECNMMGVAAGLS
jgi:transketolase